MNKRYFRCFMPLVLALSVLPGLLSGGLQEPTADCDPSFTPVVVTMESESANYCILSNAGGQAAMGA